MGNQIVAGIHHTLICFHNGKTFRYALILPWVVGAVVAVRLFNGAHGVPDAADGLFVELGDEAEFRQIRRVLTEFVDQEMVRDIPEELYSKYENVNRVMTTYAYEAMPDGKMYHLPREDRAWEGSNGNPIALFYRLDYAQKLATPKSSSIPR